MEIRVSFPGGKRVNAHVNGMIIKTDQSPRNGGEGSEPEPYTVFLSSLATCAGIYALGFCQARDLPTEGLEVVQQHQFDPDTHKLSKVTIELTIPSTMPEKYHKALLRAVDLCAVKRTILEPPQFEVIARSTPAASL